MIPKEKAKELVDKYWEHSWVLNVLRKQKTASMTFAAAKWCALVAVNEILGILFQHHEIDYWKEVKSEIEKL
jgi:hypothetical protein